MVRGRTTAFRLGIVAKGARSALHAELAELRGRLRERLIGGRGAHLLRRVDELIDLAPEVDDHLLPPPIRPDHAQARHIAAVVAERLEHPRRKIGLAWVLEAAPI